MRDEFIAKITKAIKEDGRFNGCEHVHIDITFMPDGEVCQGAIQLTGKKETKEKLISETNKLKDQLAGMVGAMDKHSKELDFEMCSMDNTELEEDTKMEPKGSTYRETEDLAAECCDECEPDVCPATESDGEWPGTYEEMLGDIYEHFDDKLADMDAGISEILEEIKRVRRTNIVLQTKKKHIESLTFAIENLEERFDEIKNTIEEVSPAWLSEETDKCLKSIEDHITSINNILAGQRYSSTQDQLINNMSQVLKDIYGKIQDNENTLAATQKMICDIVGRFNEMYEDYLEDKKKRAAVPTITAEPKPATKKPASRTTKKK